MLSSLDKYHDATKLENEEHLDKFIESLTVPGSMTPEIIGIHQDKSSLEYYVILNCIGHEDYGDIEILRLPLVKFCVRFAKKLERIVSSTAMCFIADASANLGPTILRNVLHSSTDVAVLAPEWMATLSLLIESHIIPSEKIDKIIFSLCRMESRREQENVKVSKTVVFNIPGQAFVPALLPALQRTFPCERHLFVYDGCCSAVSRSILLSRSMGVSTRLSIGSSIEKILRNYKPKLAELSDDIANSVHSWIGSVDTFSKLKDNEDQNEYLPFVLRLGFLLGRTEGIGNADSDLVSLANNW